TLPAPVVVVFGVIALGAFAVGHDAVDFLARGLGIDAELQFGARVVVDFDGAARAGIAVVAAAIAAERPGPDPADQVGGTLDGGLRADPDRAGIADLGQLARAARAAVLVVEQRAVLPAARAAAALRQH